MSRPFETPKAEIWTIDDILKKALRGELKVPVFQRNFVWKPKDILYLFDSLYRGYPVGSLLVWVHPQPLDGRSRSLAPCPLPLRPVNPSSWLMGSSASRPSWRRSWAAGSRIPSFVCISI